MRILCLGIGLEDSSEYRYIDTKSVPPTIFDYDLVIWDLSQFGSSIYKHYAKKMGEFGKFFQSKGVCFVQIYNHDTYNGTSNLDWCPFIKEIEIKNNSGETVICQNDDARFIFDAIQFGWNCFFSKYPENATILAVNRAGDPISIMVPFGSGYCIFLPYTFDNDKLLKLLITKGLNIIPEKEEEKDTAEFPPWAMEFMNETEMSLLKTRKNIIEKLGKYSKFKPLLWETGDTLQELVIEAFQEMGITITKLPKESHGDFEFPIEEDLVGVSEVKGLSGNADRRNLRQVLDYFIEQRDIEGRNVKGILIVNHYRNERPAERRNPVTKDASDLIKKYDFHVLTTTKLYDYLTQFWENKLTKDDFLKTFVN